MTDQAETWTRRRFLKLSGAVASTLLLTRSALAAGLLPKNNSSGFLDGLFGKADGSRLPWNLRCNEGIPFSAAFVAHPVHPVAYVVLETDQWQHRPRGAVSMYHYDRKRFHLTLLKTEPLSLSAINPRYATLTADGNALFVSAEGGGIYNVLPIGSDGTLLPVSAIRKEVGLEENGVAMTSAPRNVVRHADGTIYAWDQGQRTISQFAVTRDSITLLRRSRVHPVTGACDLAMPAQEPLPRLPKGTRLRFRPLTVS